MNGNFKARNHALVWCCTIVCYRRPFTHVFLVNALVLCRNNKLMISNRTTAQKGEAVLAPTVCMHTTTMNTELKKELTGSSVYHRICQRHLAGAVDRVQENHIFFAQLATYFHSFENLQVHTEMPFHELSFCDPHRSIVRVAHLGWSQFAADKPKNYDDSLPMECERRH